MPSPSQTARRVVTSSRHRRASATVSVAKASAAPSAAIGPGDPQARAGHAHEQRRDERAGSVGDGPAGRVGGADEEQRGEHREQARRVGGAEPEGVGHPHERQEQRSLAREHVPERLAAGAHRDRRCAEHAVVEGEVPLGHEGRDAQRHGQTGQDGQVRPDRSRALARRRRSGWWRSWRLGGYRAAGCAVAAVERDRVGSRGCVARIAHGGLPLTKHIFVTGGVASSLGKGITASSLGRLLKARGLRVTMQKLDPYINVDPGTMNPFEHGEVFVTDDGGETDLDLGPLRAVHRREPHPRLQRHHRLDLLGRAGRRAPRRLPRQDRPGDPAHHRRDQAPDQPADLGRDRRRHHRGRRHRRRHRDPPVPRGHPAVPPRRRPRQGLLRPRHARAADRRRAEDQAHPALRHRAARARHPARRHRRAERAGRSPAASSARSPTSATCPSRPS